MPVVDLRQGNTYIIDDGAAACRPKGFDGKCLALFHLGLVGVLHERYRLSAMNAVLLDVMGGEIPNGLDGISPPTNLDLVALHGFLDGSANVADSYIYSGGL